METYLTKPQLVRFSGRIADEGQRREFLSIIDGIAFTVPPALVRGWEGVRVCTLTVLRNAFAASKLEHFVEQEIDCTDIIIDPNRSISEQVEELDKLTRPGV